MKHIHHLHIYHTTAVQCGGDFTLFSGFALISQRRDEKDWFPYTLTFRQVLAYFTCELDTYENMAGTEYLDGSSFDLIEDSTWLKSLPVREDFDKGIYRHYRLFTYDDVYNIIAVSYEFVAEL